MKRVRAIVGSVILGIDRLTAPNPPKRSLEAQKQLDLRTEGITLYQLPACPFCVRVRRQIRRQGLSIALKSIRQDDEAAAELIAGGKLDQVPCLRIERNDTTEWLYDSNAINAYLKEQFGD